MTLAVKQLGQRSWVLSGLGLCLLGLVACGDDNANTASGVISGQMEKSSSPYIDCERQGNRKVLVGDGIEANFTTYPEYLGSAKLVTLCDAAVLSAQPIQLQNAQLEVSAALPENCGGNQSYSIALKTPHAVGLCTWSQNVISPVDNETLSEIIWLLD